MGYPCLVVNCAEEANVTAFTTTAIVTYDEYLDMQS